MKTNFKIIIENISKTKLKYILVCNHDSINEIIHYYIDFNSSNIRSAIGRWRVKKC